MSATALALALLPTSSPAKSVSLGDSAFFRIFGARAGERAGRSVAGVGDVNGDGRSDIGIGASSRAYVVFGQTAATDVALDDLGDRGFEIGMGLPGSVGDFVISSAGDINVDGLDDLLVGVATADPAAKENAGSVFIVFGNQENSKVVLDDPSSARVLRLDGARAGDRAGHSVAAAGDVDGDSVPDILIGAPKAYDDEMARKGVAYVVFGRALTRNIDLAVLGSDGYSIHSPPRGRDLGWSVAGAGDMSGDGLADAIVGAPSNLVIAPPGAYVVFGQTATADVALDALEGHGWRITAGERENEEGAGASVSGGQDVNGDGVPDVVVGAPSAAAPFSRNGVAFVIFGKSDLKTVHLDDLGGVGFRVEAGMNVGDVGHSVALAPDVDGNGLADVLVGAPEGYEFGAFYDLTGQMSTEIVNLGQLGKDGVRFTGEAYEQIGYAVAALGDIDADGVVELATGAPLADTEVGEKTGLVYVVKPVEPPPFDPPPRALLLSYGARQKGALGSYCWDLCVDRDPTFPRSHLAGVGDRAHLRLGTKARPDEFAIVAYRDVDEFGHPVGNGGRLDTRLRAWRNYQGAPIAGYESLFELPRRAGDLYLAVHARWAGVEPRDVSWNFHLRLKHIPRSDLRGPPNTTLISGDARQKGALFSYCWSNTYSDGTGSTLCADYIRLESRPAANARTGARATLRIHTRFRPDRMVFRIYRDASSGYPSGHGRRINYRWRAHRVDGELKAWDARFRLPERLGHVYPLMHATWDDHGTAPYDWHLQLR